MKLKDRVSLITGGGIGIGAAIAKAFAKEGAKVFITGRREEPLQQTVKVIQASKNQAGWLSGDVAMSDDAKRMVEACVKQFGRLDILVNNAGILGPQGKITEISETDWDRVFATNVKGIYQLCRFAIPVMIKNVGGSIINISSVCGLKGWKGLAAYCASKAAVNLLTKTLALDHASDKIRVNAICPSSVYTGSPPDLSSPARKDLAAELGALAKLHPLGRIGQPEDIAPLAIYLASDESGWVTGTIFPIDGGLLA